MRKVSLGMCLFACVGAHGADGGAVSRKIVESNGEVQFTVTRTYTAPASSFQDDGSGGRFSDAISELGRIGYDADGNLIFGVLDYLPDDSMEFVTSSSAIAASLHWGATRTDTPGLGVRSNSTIAGPLVVVRREGRVTRFYVVTWDG
jgi:hypothetical protein